MVDYYEKSSTRAKKLGRYYLPQNIEQEAWRESIVKNTLEDYLSFLLNTIRLSLETASIPDWSECQIKVIRKRKDIHPAILKFSENGYDLVKITFPIKKDTFLKELSSIPSIEIITKNVNRSLNQTFYWYISSCVSNQNSIEQGIDHAFKMLLMLETDIKRSTIKRYLHRHRKTANIFKLARSLNGENLHKKIYNKKLFEIYRDQIENNLSFSKLAEKYNITKSMAYRICSNPNISNFYKKVTRYHENYTEWILKK